MIANLVRVILVPSAVFLSVLFGGSFGSGREVVQFMSDNGPAGGFITIAIIAAVYSICLFLSFELSRLYRAYEYRSFYKLLLGRGWVIYELFITLAVIVALAICASSSGEVLNSRFGLPTLLGGFLLLLLVAALNYGGRDIVERSMVASVLALAAILVVLLIIVLATRSDAISSAFNIESSISGAVSDGFKYSITNVGFIPLLLFCGTQLRNRRETLLAGAFAGVSAIAPAIVFHFTFLADYPNVLGQTLPTYVMIEALTPGWFLDIYVVVLFVLIVQTGVGMLQGAIERIDSWRKESTGAGLGRLGHAAFASTAVLASAALSLIGLVNLIAQGYNYLSIVFALIFVLPLLLIGIPKIVRASRIANQT